MAKASKHKSGTQRGKHAGKPRAGNPNYNPAKGLPCLVWMVGPLTVLAGLILCMVALTGCTHKAKPPVGVSVAPRPPATASTATQAVCSATRNAYFQDAIGSDITGKAIFDLSNQQGVAASVKNSVHNLFSANGKALSNPDAREAAYEKVMAACTAAGWAPK